jgi:hypothetical protein
MGLEHSPQGGSSWGQTLETLKFRHDAEPARRCQSTGNLVLASLVVRWWTESSRRRWLQREPIEIAIKREIEIQSRLLAIGNDIQPGGNLVVNCGNDRILLKFVTIGIAKLIEMLTGKL